MSNNNNNNNDPNRRKPFSSPHLAQNQSQYYQPQFYNYQPQLSPNQQYSPTQSIQQQGSPSFRQVQTSQQTQYSSGTKTYIPLSAASKQLQQPISPSYPIKVQSQSIESLRLHELDERRKELLDSVPQNKDGLQLLLSKRAWKTSLFLIDKCLEETHYKHDLLQIRFARLFCYVKLGWFGKAAEDLADLGELESATYRYESYQELYPGKKGSFVPFSLFVLASELPFHLGEPVKSIELLCQLRARCLAEIQQIISLSPPEILSQTENKYETNGLFDTQLQPETIPIPTLHDLQSNDTPQEQIKLWRQRENRVILSIVTRLIHQKDHHEALLFLDQLLERYPTDTSLISFIGRLHLQIGTIELCAKKFEQVKSLSNNSSIQDTVLLLQNRGLLMIGQGRYEQAITAFEQILKHETNNVSAANNRSICFLHIRQLSKAITSLEEVLFQDPESTLCETLVFNLCTLYDLANERASERKKYIQQLVLKYADEAFDVSVLKLTT